MGSVGGILVSGSGSELQIGSAAFFSDNDLYVGNSGTGTLTVTGGAKVSDDSGFVAFQNASTGSVSVDGTGSVWSNRINLLVSGFGLPGNVSDGTVTVSNGGTIEALQQMLVEPAGKVQGNGFITGTVQNNGLVAPGFPLGALQRHRRLRANFLRPSANSNRRHRRHAIRPAPSHRSDAIGRSAGHFVQ